MQCHRRAGYGFLGRPAEALRAAAQRDQRAAALLRARAVAILAYDGGRLPQRADRADRRWLVSHENPTVWFCLRISVGVAQ